ncbi:MAG TPA: FliH/SctL family protein [Fervidobacterium sp.]|nr:FliH/SctL family protein [Fervidobacterium sp.]HPT54874.1 FliH/SctL family protein [Fervidobacterium sp.]HPZ18466.1 FliH/SctL family protein [Fervidobacterium sp.]HQE49764.1 FliH/SctL family protein [Fervidobacterium sp.]HUM43874.1 FliH/SctL family protein [Fervidobacterium sp.]
MLIRKRYVYLDAPLKIENRIEEDKTRNVVQDEEKREKTLEMVAKANKEAERIISEARLQADKILDQAQEEYVYIISQANQSAEDIIAQAQEEAQKSIETVNKQLQTILDTFEKALNNLLDLYSEKMTSVSERLAEKFLEKEIDSDVTKRKLKKVLSHLVSATKVKIRINPNDMRSLEEEIINRIKSQGFELISDPAVESGVVAETDIGTIDTTLNFQLTLLDEIFEEVFNINKKE